MGHGRTATKSNGQVGCGRDGCCGLRGGATTEAQQTGPALWRQNGRGVKYGRVRSVGGTVRDSTAVHE
jgi:hypothetical protein